MTARPHETTEFNCTLCGECCRDNQEVWLNPTDIKRLARHLGLNGEQELHNRAVITYAEGQNGITRPKIRFRRTPLGRNCPFLQDSMDHDGCLRGRCKLHFTDAKPLVCRLAPLARTINLATGEEDWKEVPPLPGCPGWPQNPPPLEGRPIPAPELSPDVRSDLNRETDYFRTLARKAAPSKES